MGGGGLLTKASSGKSDVEEGMEDNLGHRDRESGQCDRGEGLDGRYGLSIYGPDGAQSG